MYRLPNDGDKRDELKEEIAGKLEMNEEAEDCSNAIVAVSVCVWIEGDFVEMEYWIYTLLVPGLL